MSVAANVWKKLAASLVGSPPPKRRRPLRLELSWDRLEERKVLSHGGAFPNNAIALATSFSSHIGQSSQRNSHHTGTETTTNDDGTSTTTNSALSTALQTLHNDVQTIELASGTTVAELTAIRVGFRALAADGLTPTSRSALSTFENGLVTTLAGGTSLTGNGTLLGQFEALYTSSVSSLTTTQQNDLKSTYDALAAAVTSANITPGNIATIDKDWLAVLAARNSSSTATYPYFSLVTGEGGGAGGGGGCH